MDCTNCLEKSCRKELQKCNAVKFNQENILTSYKNNLETKKIIEVSAQLVDNGRAGKLSRVEEIIEFCKKMNYQHIGLAYCYGMEKTANDLKIIFKHNGLALLPISCSVGGLCQDEINEKSCIHKVSCNPLGQAAQLSSEQVDFVIIMGICLGHDIILQKNLNCDFTTLIVKDRINNHNPLQSIKNLITNI